MFKIVATAVLGLLSLSPLAAASSIQSRDVPVLHNGQNVSFVYSDSIVGVDTLFGLGLLRTNAATPPKVTDGWEGPILLNFDDFDVIPATYVLQYPFFQNGSSYTVQLFQYNTNTLEVVEPHIHNATFIWVNQPGQNI